MEHSFSSMLRHQHNLTGALIRLSSCPCLECSVSLPNLQSAFCSLLTYRKYFWTGLLLKSHAASFWSLIQLSFTVLHGFLFEPCGAFANMSKVGVNRRGQVLSVSVDETTIIPYLLQNPANSGLAVKLASRAGLPGADNLYAGQFDTLLSSGNYAEAAKIAANSPRGFLRTPQTIERFKAHYLSFSNILACFLTREH
jgi:hypothetical protein